VITRQMLVAEARSWIGTPVMWKQSQKGRATDCKGLIAGIARELRLPEAQSLAARVTTYSRSFCPAELIEGLDATLRRTEKPGPGDVVGIMIVRRDGPRHLAMLSDRPGWVIHAYGAGFDKVAEVPLAGERKVWGYWTWPSLAAGGRLGD
jgi:cell wall-associated NlpC family hydrolase